MIFADGKGGKMEQVEKWCRVHKKACLVTGIMGLLLAPFLWPVFLAVNCAEPDDWPSNCSRDLLLQISK